MIVAPIKTFDFESAFGGANACWHNCLLAQLLAGTTRRCMTGGPTACWRLEHRSASLLYSLSSPLKKSDTPIAPFWLLALIGLATIV
ncbi:MAG: hypothetical protein EBS62_08965 [Betaproteobacteria bacterium]|nr:hypothetical protein [Betaproteobacteria bacterium]